MMFAYGPISHLYVVVAGMLAAGVALKKFELDRHKCWYKSLASHLDAIEDSQK